MLVQVIDSLTLEDIKLYKDIDRVFLEVIKEL